ncbi:MAG: hypothetical protein QMA98_04380 [Pseudomonadales bacterium]
MDLSSGQCVVQRMHASAILMVIRVELLNTGIALVVDRIGLGFHAFSRVLRLSVLLQLGWRDGCSV